jgi:hypothetical protein
MLSRLGVVQHRLQTSSAEKGVSNLVETLEDGMPAIVWADMYGLPYYANPDDEGMWMMFPIVVYGYDTETDKVWIADRASVPLTVTPAQLQTARAKVKKDKFRVMTLDPPQPEKLASAVTAGIWDCIKLYTEKPPKGTRKNFGLQALQNWASLLTEPKIRLSWAREFPPGREMFAALVDAYHDINIFTRDDRADRNLYAEFLEEASLILEKPALMESAALFRRCSDSWGKLSSTLLPDSIAPFAEARELMRRRRQLFIEQGGEATHQLRQIDSQLDHLRTAMETEFPLDEAGATAMRQEIAEQVLALHDVEREAVTALKAMMSD